MSPTLSDTFSAGHSERRILPDADECSSGRIAEVTIVPGMRRMPSERVIPAALSEIPDAPYGADLHA